MGIFWLFFWRFYRAACHRACSAAPGSSPCWWWRRTANWEPGTAETTLPAGGWGRISGSEERGKKNQQERELTAKKHGSGPIISVGRPKHLRTGYSFTWLRLCMPGKRHLCPVHSPLQYSPHQGFCNIDIQYWISIYRGGCGWYSGARDGGNFKDTWFGTRLL